MKGFTVVVGLVLFAFVDLPAYSLYQHGILGFIEWAFGNGP
jgi:hypothetical protein